MYEERKEVYMNADATVSIQGAWNIDFDGVLLSSCLFIIYSSATIVVHLRVEINARAEPISDTKFLLCIVVRDSLTCSVRNRRLFLGNPSHDCATGWIIFPLS